MKKILLVNASRYFFDEGKSLLERKDFQVFQATTAMHALQIHLQEHANLIVSELDLPEMGGDALCSRIRENADFRFVSFILVCNKNPIELARAANCGANICLHKPFTARSLLEHVEKLLTISVRRGYRVLLRVRVRGAQEGLVFFCTSQNVSVSGMLIETDRPIMAGEHLSCSFYLEGSAQIIVEGEVVRAAPSVDGKFHCGIRFIMISPEHKLAIEKFIADTIIPS